MVRPGLALAGDVAVVGELALAAPVEGDRGEVVEYVRTGQAAVTHVGQGAGGDDVGVAGGPDHQGARGAAGGHDESVGSLS